MKIALILLVLANCIYALVYYWPLPELSDKCNGTFCEYRVGPPAHFHEGIDIPTGVSWYTVWSATYAFKCIKIGYLNGGTHGRYVTIQHYEDDGQASCDEGSRYLHMWNINPNLSEGTVYINVNISPPQGTGFWNEHLHFELREPAPVVNDDKNSFNPFMYYSLTDNDAPFLDYLYADGSTDHQGDATINSWNFLKYSFMSYYDSTSVSPFIRLTLPAESRDNDLDDPHIMISGNRKVRFVLKAKDQVTSSYPNCAPYWIAVYLDTALAPGNEENPIIEGTNSLYEVKFDCLRNSVDDEVHDEEDVYHVESPLISTNSVFYYRLYPYDVNSDGLPDCILTSNYVFKTENLEEGQHRLRIVVKDFKGNTKTADIHLYIRKEDWVDYSRAFRN